MHVSWWHQAAALTYALYLHSSINVIRTGREQASAFERFEEICGADPSCVWDSWYTERPSGPVSVWSHVVGTSNGLRLKLESLSFCCSQRTLTVSRRDVVWCVFWRRAALSTPRPRRWHHGSWGPQGDSEWRVGRRSLVKETHRERQTDIGRRDRERQGEGCPLKWPVPRARGECSVQQTAWWQLKLLADDILWSQHAIPPTLFSEITVF